MYLNCNVDFAVVLGFAVLQSIQLTLGWNPFMVLQTWSLSACLSCICVFYLGIYRMNLMKQDKFVGRLYWNFMEIVWVMSQLWRDFYFWFTLLCKSLAWFGLFQSGLLHWKYTQLISIEEYFDAINILLLVKKREDFLSPLTVEGQR